MPVIKIMTNVKSSQIADGFEQRLAGVLAKSMNKNLEYMFVVVTPGQMMARGDSCRDIAVVEITSNSRLSCDENEKHTVAICDFLKTELLLEPTEVLINFTVIAADMIGYNGHVLSKLAKR